MKSIQITNVQVSKFEDLHAVDTASLLSFYNAETGKNTSKFASRSKGMMQVWALVEAKLSTIEEPSPHAASNKLIGEALAREAAQEAPKKERKARGFRFKFTKRDEIKAVKEGSKRAALLELLKQEGGATFEECMAATGWNRKDCYEGIRLLHYYVGYGLNQDEKTGKIWVIC